VIADRPGASSDPETIAANVSSTCHFVCSTPIGQRSIARRAHADAQPRHDIANRVLDRASARCRGTLRDSGERPSRPRRHRRTGDDEARTLQDHRRVSGDHRSSRPHDDPRVLGDAIRSAGFEAHATRRNTKNPMFWPS
jgi:hypothetical protein